MKLISTLSTLALTLVIIPNVFTTLTAVIYSFLDTFFVQTITNANIHTVSSFLVAPVRFELTLDRV
jgi:hypothetical protein